MDKYTLFVPTRQEAAGIFGLSDFVEYNGFEGGWWNGKFVHLAGFSKTNSAITLAVYLSKVNDETIPLLIGIAGAYRNSGLKPGDMALISRDFFVDEALYTGILQTTDELGFGVCPANRVDFLVPQEFNLPIVTANTVSLLPGTDEMSRLYQEKTGASLESMEGASFALAAARFGKQAVQIRAVSNYCGDRARQEWNIKKAFKTLSDFVSIFH